MGESSKRGKLIKRGVRAILVAVLAALMLGIAVEHLARWRVAKAFPPPGQLVQVNGGQLHLNAQVSEVPPSFLRPASVWAPPRVGHRCRTRSLASLVSVHMTGPVCSGAIRDRGHVTLRLLRPSWPHC